MNRAGGIFPLPFHPLPPLSLSSCAPEAVGEGLVQASFLVLGLNISGAVPEESKP